MKKIVLCIGSLLVVFVGVSVYMAYEYSPLFKTKKSAIIDFSGGESKYIVTATPVEGGVKDEEMDFAGKPFGVKRVDDGDIYFMKVYLVKYEHQQKTLMLSTQQDNRVTGYVKQIQCEKYKLQQKQMGNAIAANKADGLVVIPPPPPFSTGCVTQRPYPKPVPMGKKNDYFVVKIKEKYDKPVFSISADGKYYPSEIHNIINPKNIVENCQAGRLFSVKPYKM
jgi:hypothetical protein